MECSGTPTGFGRFESVLSALAVPVLVVGESNAIAYANPAAEGLLGVSAATLLDGEMTAVFSYDSPIIALVQKARRLNGVVKEHGILLSTPRIAGIEISVGCSPLGGDSGAVVMTLQENTAAEKLGNLVSVRNTALPLASMASVFAHEVKNPLSGVRGAAQLLEQNLAPEDRDLTGLIIDETDRIFGLVDRFDVFSDLPELNRTEVNIHRVLDRVVMVAKNGFGKNTEIITNYDPSLPPLLGEEDRLIQLFLNLAKNACEAVAETGGQVRITTAFRHGMRLAMPTVGTHMALPLSVTVEDNGVGIDATLRRQVFDPFVTMKPGGTGLGLALVAKLVRDHGGTIDLRSEGGITAFEVMLPIMQAMPAETESAGTEDEDTEPADKDRAYAG